MGWYKIKIDSADREFSRFVRLRDGKCVRCGKTVNLQTSHYWGRGKESTRFEPDNADALCSGCHRDWEHQKELTIKGELVFGDYAWFKFHQLGEKRYNSLKVQAHTFQKKDRKLSLLKVKELIKNL